MDGTLCDVSSIRHLVQGKVKNFHAFHMESASCPPNLEVVQKAHDAKQAGRAVLIVTARTVEYRNVTAVWLALHGVPSDALYMRRSGDFRKDFLVKKDILSVIRKTWNPVHAYDDNPAVVQLWESEGIPATVIPGWE